MWDSAELKITPRYKIVNHSWQEIGEITDITGGKITRNYLTSTKEGATLDYQDTAQLLDIGSNYLRIYLEADETIALGTFLCSTPSQEVTDIGTSGSATCYSILQVLADEKLDATLTIYEDTDPISYATTLITNRGLNCIAQETDKTLANDVTFDTDSSILDVVVWCCEYANFNSPMLDGYGTILLSPYIAPSKRAASYTFEPSSTSIFFASVSHELDTFSTPNKIIVVSNNADSCITANAINSDPDSPLSTVSRGRTITSTYNYDVTTQSEAQTVANRLLAEVSAVEHVVISHLFTPEVTLNSMCGINYAGLKKTNLNVVKQEIDLSGGIVVTSDARRYE